VTCRTPAEIDEMYVNHLSHSLPLLKFFMNIILTQATTISRFEKRVNLRKFKGYVTEVQMRSTEQREDHEMVTTA
jgi:hypothetical protein